MVSPTPLVRYQYNDHLGSATLETDMNANLISYEEYHPFGTTAYSTYVNSSYSTKRYRFSNKERDDETGLYYFGVRYYAAWLGRWTSSDPADFIDGLNLYRYVRNNPVNLVDADGRSSDPPDEDGDPVKHKIVRNDNLTHIAREYDVTVDNLIKWNNLAGSSMSGSGFYPGDELIVSDITVEDSDAEDDSPPKNQSVIVYLSGLYSNGVSDQYNRTFDSDYENNINEAMESNFPDIEYVMESFNSVGFDFRTKDDAAKFINENLGENGQLIIIGYSWGGDTAYDLSWPNGTPQKELGGPPDDDLIDPYDNPNYNPINRPIDLLILVDGADGPLFLDNERTFIPIGSLAKVTYNFYQNITQTVTRSGMRKVQSNSTAHNILLLYDWETGDQINHSNIDEYTIPYITRLVTQKLNNVPANELQLR